MTQKTTNEWLQRTAVLGAGGKMGRGIALLLLNEIAPRVLQGEEHFAVILIDTEEKALEDLRDYLRQQLRKTAEKTINVLRGIVAERKDLVSNREVIDAYIEAIEDVLYFSTDPTAAKESLLIFEAIVEDVQVKTSVFSSIESVATKAPYYFSNTSSIPIGILSEKAFLDGRLIGFHFYNPPPVQKLLEIIPAERTKPELQTLAMEIGQRLKKTCILSKDVAGFIGNGHFMREIAFACDQVRKLQSHYSREEAITFVDRVTKELLVRPMGIFQLLDYIGLDVCARVFTIMERYLKTPFDSSLLDLFLQHHVTGGQEKDGSQKEGIFSYEKGVPEKIYDGKRYIALPNVPIEEKNLPSWKELHKQKERGEILNQHFDRLLSSNSEGARLARAFLKHSKEVGEQLLKEGVAQNREDLDQVLMGGFYHLYGFDPIKEGCLK